jgi:Tfp pilus assembly protein PilF
MVSETQSPVAYDHYSRGRALFRTLTRENNEAAKREFSEAIRLDPNFARAHGWLAYAHLEDIQEGWTDDPARSAALSLGLAVKGVDLGRNDYYTHWNLAAIHAGLKDMERALAEYNAALALNSTDADLLADIADMLSYRGEADKAVEQIRRAMDLKIPQWYHWSLGFAYFQKRQYGEAAAALEKMTDPPNTAYLLLVACKAQLGSPTPREDIMARLLGKDPNWTPNHLARFPFVRPEDREHYLATFAAAGIPVPGKP